MYEVKYLERLAKVYLDKYGEFGYTHAKAWFDEFLTEELRVLVKPLVEAEVKRRGPPRKGS
jgi:hypothetical protein